MTTAAFTGSFDPITNGHTDLITRAALLFETILVAVGPNSAKNNLFDRDERVALAEAALNELQNVHVITYDGLTADFAVEHNVQTFIRGMRTSVDLDYEYRMAWMNRHLNPQVDTMYLTPEKQNMGISSTVIREVARYQGDVTPFVHPAVAKALQQKFA